MNINDYRQLDKAIGGISLDLSSQNVIFNTPEYTLQFLADMLSNRYERNVEVLVINSIDDIRKEKTQVVLKGDEVLELEVLDKLGLLRVTKVWNENEYSVLGDVVVLWPKGSNNPYRLSLFGNKVEEITEVDAQTRQKIRAVSELKIGLSQGVLRRYTGNIMIESKGDMSVFYIPEFRRDLIINTQGIVFHDLNIRKIPGIYANNTEKTMSNILDAYRKQGYVSYYLGGQLDFEKYFLISKFDHLIIEAIPILTHGFINHSDKSLVVTENDVLGVYDLTEDSDKRLSSEDVFKKFAVGDYVVHEDHGIGIFTGIKESNDSEYIELKYAGKDRLLIPTAQFKKLSRYIGAGKKVPTLTGLNSGVWKRVKRGVEHDVMEIAKELVQLYAMRNSINTRPIIDTYEEEKEYEKFVEEFEFEDTEDQFIISKQILEDFKREKLMDRLVIGDVGFGKTELAYRAAFACANAGLQVAFLAPTTILVHQHFKNIKERFSKYAFEIAELSRLVKGGDRDEIIEKLEAGTTDIVVGTHTLLADSVKFKNLGLIIIDEEQKFGVKQKEKLKQKRADTHVLSLSATPIPRTLSIALNGIRDMSVLASVPNDRKAIRNWFGDFNWGVVNTAILEELNRGGQVYYLHNRVADLENIKKDLENLNPKIKVGVVNGRMGGQRINEVMKEFIDGKYNILLSTTIIENGLDIRNVNTLIVDDAQRYGLSQLYQIRGRIGRSDRQAYAFFMHQSLGGNSELRLNALEESEALGSGFLLSNRDLEIRGAGNILGREQSGVINSVGYGLYSQMLKEAVDSLK